MNRMGVSSRGACKILRNVRNRNVVTIPTLQEQKMENSPTPVHIDVSPSSVQLSPSVSPTQSPTPSPSPTQSLCLSPRPAPQMSVLLSDYVNSVVNNTCYEKYIGVNEIKNIIICNIYTFNCKWNETHDYVEIIITLPRRCTYDFMELSKVLSADGIILANVTVNDRNVISDFMPIYRFKNVYDLSEHVFELIIRK